mgnify:CR=1 FL=1
MKSKVGLRNKISRYWISRLLMGVLVLSITNCSTQRAIRLKNKSIKEWQSFQLHPIKQSKKGENAKWTVYTRKIKGGNFIEYQIVGDINATPSECLSNFKKDIEKLAKGFNPKKYPIYEIVRNSTDSLLTYVIHNEPFPLKDTEMSVNYTFSEEKGKAGVKWREAWEESMVEPSKKLSRVESFRGSWVFTAMAGNKSQATNSLSFDPKGMPRWLYEPMVMKFLKDGLSKLRADNSN